jgi:hypothetical protein
MVDWAEAAVLSESPAAEKPLNSTAGTGWESIGGGDSASGLLDAVIEAAVTKVAGRGSGDASLETEDRCSVKEVAH